MEEPFSRPLTNISWEAVQDTGKLIFSIWVGQAELVWARSAWQALTEANLTTYSDESGCHTVLFRLLVLGGIYADFCGAAWDEYSEPCYWNWAQSLELDLFVLGQLYERLSGWKPMDQSASEALDQLVEEERRVVVVALMKGFGGASGLYAALWKSMNVKRADDEQCEPDKDDTYDAATSQLSAYSWVEQGCCRYR